MKCIIVAILLLNSIMSFAQIDAKQLCNERVKLNGGIRSQFGGMSRTGLYLQLPPNTKYIYLAITISTTNDHINGVGLTTSIASLLGTGNILSISDISQHLQGQPGEGILDFRVYQNKDCAQYFINKVNSNCYSYYSRSNSIGGIYQIPIENPYLPYYLCFRNPSEYNAVYFHIEATAITDTD